MEDKMNWKYRVQKAITGEWSPFFNVKDCGNKEVEKIIRKCRYKYNSVSHDSTKRMYTGLKSFNTNKRYVVDGTTYRVSTQLLVKSCGNARFLKDYGSYCQKVYDKLHIYKSSNDIPKHLENKIDWRWSKDEGTIRGYGSENIPDPNAKWIVWETIKIVGYTGDWDLGYPTEVTEKSEVFQYSPDRKEIYKIERKHYRG